MKISIKTRKFGIKDVFFDDEYISLLSEYKWVVAKSRGREVFYAYGYDFKNKIWNSKVSMHSLILGVKAGYDIDHIDGDGLNNKLSNLRHASRSQNSINTKTGKSNTTGYKGVCRNKRTGRFICYLTKEYKTTYGGSFVNVQTAAYAYNLLAEKYFGNYARVNKLTEDDLKIAESEFSYHTKKNKNKAWIQ